MVGIDSDKALLFGYFSGAKGAQALIRKKHKEHHYGLCKLDSSEPLSPQNPGQVYDSEKNQSFAEKISKGQGGEILQDSLPSRQLDSPTRRIVVSQ